MADVYSSNYGPYLSSCPTGGFGIIDGGPSENLGGKRGRKKITRCVKRPSSNKRVPQYSPAGCYRAGRTQRKSPSGALYRPKAAKKTAGSSTRYVWVRVAVPKKTTVKKGKSTGKSTGGMTLAAKKSKYSSSFKHGTYRYTKKASGSWSKKKIA